MDTVNRVFHNAANSGKTTFYEELMEIPEGFFRYGGIKAIYKMRIKVLLAKKFNNPFPSQHQSFALREDPCTAKLNKPYGAVTQN